jgi:hypothetical protein
MLRDEKAIRDEQAIKEALVTIRTRIGQERRAPF